MVNPYSEEHLSSTEVVRIFSSDLHPDELKWHWDEENRIVEFINENDWQFQFDNLLPQKCQGKIYIKAGTWHRIIKGSSDLEVKITKSENKSDI
jgi:hypothetical protein